MTGVTCGLPSFEVVARRQTSLDFRNASSLAVNLTMASLMTGPTYVFRARWEPRLGIEPRTFTCLDFPFTKVTLYQAELSRRERTTLRIRFLVFAKHARDVDEEKRYRGRDSHGAHFEPATFGDIAILSGFHILADYESRPRMGVAGAMGQAMLPRRLRRTKVTM